MVFRLALNEVTTQVAVACRMPWADRNCQAARVVEDPAGQCRMALSGKLTRHPPPTVQSCLSQDHAGQLLTHGELTEYQGRYRAL